VATRFPPRDADVPVARAASFARLFGSPADRAALVGARAANWPGLADADDAPKRGGGSDRSGGGRGGGGASRSAGAKKKKRGGGAKSAGGKSEKRERGDRGSSERTSRVKGGRRSAGGTRGGRGARRVDRDDSTLRLGADGSTAWRLFGVTLSLHDDPGKDSFEVTDFIRDAVAHALGLPHLAGYRSDGSGEHLLRDGDGYGIRLVRKSCDARVKNAPVFQYVIDVDDVCINSAVVATGEIKPPVIARVPKRRERAPRDWDEDLEEDGVLDEYDVEGRDSLNDLDDGFDPPTQSDQSDGGSDDDRVVIVGMGPCGLFAALALTERGVPVTVLERGQPVEERGRDIGALFARRKLNEDSNLCYGEGGAGTWSDGKLTTRIGRNGDDVRSVLRALVAFGAPEGILVAGKPHLGTDRLVRILRNAREYLEANGANIVFGQTVESVAFETIDAEIDAEASEASEKKKRGGRRTRRVAGVWTKTNRGDSEKSDSDRDGVTAETKEKEGSSFVRASAVILASGHSARNLFETMHLDGVALEYQPFAAGFRIEHPQVLLDTLQYGSELAPLAARGKGKLPVADYRLAHTVVVGETSAGGASEASGAFSSPKKKTENASTPGHDARACYSFCMCPGGQIVPTSTDPNELCVNGMSFSKRNSEWANSGLVSAISFDDAFSFCAESDDDDDDDDDATSSSDDDDASRLERLRARSPLVGLDFQRKIERAAAKMGGGDLVVPVQTAPDFLEGRLTDVASLPRSSYRLGVKPARLDTLYPKAVTEAVKASLRAFDKQMPGYAGPEALLHAPEARTSSPVRVVRDKDDGQSITALGLFPAGEGAGYAGGIVSAAVDGIQAADKVMQAMERRSNVK
jgi:uncharacterized FAD-dependent dehydrogenase